jgi:hypothetical protein
MAFPPKSEPIDINDKFNVGISLMDYPGDPMGEASEVVNCFSGDTFVSTNGARKSIQSVYTGKMITIKTANGHKITVTPNHPILTDCGFIRADRVDYRTNIVCCDIDKSIHTAFDVNDIPIKFEQIHNAFAVKGVIMRIAGVNVNLYGRIPNSNVNVVDIDRQLLNTVKATFIKRFSKLRLKQSNFSMRHLFSLSLFNAALSMKFRRFVTNSLISRLDLVRSLLIAHLRPFNGLGFTLVANMDTQSFKGGTYNSTANTKFNGDLILAQEIIDIHAFNSIGINSNTPWNINTGKLVADSVTSSVDGRFRMTCGSANFFHGQSRFVHLDNPVDINSHFVKNKKVYTLETDIGIYNANGIISSNCRCAIGYVTPTFG